MNLAGYMIKEDSLSEAFYPRYKAIRSGAANVPRERADDILFDVMGEHIEKIEILMKEVERENPHLTQALKKRLESLRYERMFPRNTGVI